MAENICFKGFCCDEILLLSFFINYTFDKIYLFQRYIKQNADFATFAWQFVCGVCARGCGFVYLHAFLHEYFYFFV